MQKTLTIFGCMALFTSGCGNGLNVGGNPRAITYTQSPPSAASVGESVPVSFQILPGLASRMKALRYRVTSPTLGLLQQANLETTARSFTWNLSGLSSAPDGVFSLIITDNDGIETTLSRPARIVSSISTIGGARTALGGNPGTAAQSRFSGPTGIASDGTYLYVAGGNMIRRVSIATGESELFAGKYGETLGTNTSDDTRAIKRAFFLAVLGTYLYYTDRVGHTLRRVNTNPAAADFKTIQLVAGSDGISGTTDGIGAAARFNGPTGIASDGTNLYLTDINNHCVRRVDPTTQNVTVFSGLCGTSGYANGSAAATRYSSPRGITVNGVNLYVLDNSFVIRQIDLGTGVSTVLSGSGVQGQVDGAAGASSFLPSLLTTDATDIYALDPSAHTIRRVSLATGATSLVAGSPFQFGYTQGAGLSTARLAGPGQGAVVGTTLYFVDEGSSSLRSLNLITGVVSAFSGGLVDTSLDTSASFPWTGNATIAGGARFLATQDGNRFFYGEFRGHTLRELNIANNTLTTIAGSPGQNGNTLATGSAARFWDPTGLAWVGSTLYVADQRNNSIKAMDTSTYSVSLFAGSAAGGSGTSDGSGSAARFNAPYGLASDGVELFIADRSNHCIRRSSLSGNVSTLAGLCGTFGSTDASGSSARLRSPAGLALSADSLVLYAADSSNHTIRAITIATGAVTTPFGTVGVAGSADGVGNAATFNTPVGLYASASKLYALDGTGLIRECDLATLAVTTILGRSGVSNSAPLADASAAGAVCGSPFGMSGFGTNLYPTCAGMNVLRALDTSTQIFRAIGAKASSNISSGVASLNDGPALLTQLGFQTQAVSDGSFIYSADAGNYVIFRMNADGSGRTTLAGSLGVAGTQDGVGTSARLTRVNGMALVGQELFFGQPDSGTIRKLNLNTLAVTTIAGTANVFGTADGTGSSAQFYGNLDFVSDGRALYIAEVSNHTVRKLSLLSSNYGQVETWAGSAGISGSADGAGTAARFKSPTGVALLKNQLYLSDADNSTLRRISIETAEVTTIVGAAGVPGNSGGTGVAARITNPTSLTTDGVQTFFVSDSVVYRLDPDTLLVSQFFGQPDSVIDPSDGSLQGVGSHPTNWLRFFSGLGFYQFSNIGARRIQ